MKKHYCEFLVFRANQIHTHGNGIFYQPMAKCTVTAIEKMKLDWLEEYYRQHPDEPKDLTICITFTVEID